MNNAELKKKDKIIAELQEKIAEYHNAYEGKKHQIYKLEEKVRALLEVLERAKVELLCNHYSEDENYHATILKIDQVQSVLKRCEEE